MHFFLRLLDYHFTIMRYTPSTKTPLKVSLGKSSSLIINVNIERYPYIYISKMMICLFESEQLFPFDEFSETFIVSPFKGHVQTLRDISLIVILILRQNF